MPNVKDYIIATRPWSFSMSLISVLLGTLLAAEHGPVHWGWFAVVATGIVLCHAAGNVLNDYFDARNRVDRADSPTALYRPHPILSGLMSPRWVLLEAVVLLGLAGASGAILTVVRSPHVAWIALAGVALTVFYTGWPVAYKYRALGELGVFLVWGPLMFQGAYVVQRQELSAPALVASIPFGALVALVLFANNIRDIAHDGRSDVRTLGILLGQQRSLAMFAALMLSAYVYVAVAVALGALSPWVLLVWLSLPMAVSLLRQFTRQVPEAADAVTARLDTVFGLLFVVSLVLQWTV